jgi:hypothetical protein
VQGEEAAAATQASLLAQAQSHGAALQQRLNDRLQQITEEKKSHEGTRALLATALANVVRRKGRQNNWPRLLLKSKHNPIATRFCESCLICWMPGSGSGGDLVENGDQCPVSTSRIVG